MVVCFWVGDYAHTHTREVREEKKLGTSLLARPDDHSFAREGIGLVSTLVLRMGYIVERMAPK